MAKEAFRARDLVEAERLARIAPKGAPSLSLLGRIEALTGRFQQAVASFSSALSFEPGSIEALSGLAATYWQIGDLSSAAAAYERICSLEGSGPIPHKALGQVRLLQGENDKAARAFQSAIDRGTGSAELHHLRGVAFHKSDRLDEAVAEYRMATSIDPGLSEAWDALGHALLSSGDPTAHLIFEKGAETATEGAAKYLLRAKALTYGQGDLTQAEAYVRQALDKDPQNVSAYSLLGIIQQQLGRFEDAKSTLTIAVRYGPDEVAPYVDIVKSGQVVPGDQEFVDRIVDLSKDPRLRPSDRIRLLFALGKAYDDLGQYGEAFDILLQAWKERRDLLRLDYDPQRSEAEIRAIISKYDRKRIASFRNYGSNDQLPVLVVGMHRSGTTLTERIFSAHSQIGGAGELRFWTDCVSSDEVYDSEPEAAAKIGSEYLQVLRRFGTDKKRITDKAPWNYMFLGRYLLSFHSGKIVHVHRHPVDNCISILMTPFAHPPRSAITLEGLVSEYRLYQRLMSHWRDTIPKAQLLEVAYREIVENNEATARRLIDFVDLPWDDRCLHPESSEQDIRTASVWQARQPIFQTSMERWKNYDPWLGPLRELLDD